MSHEGQQELQKRVCGVAESAKPIACLRFMQVNEKADAKVQSSRPGGGGGGESVLQQT